MKKSEILMGATIKKRTIGNYFKRFDGVWEIVMVKNGKALLFQNGYNGARWVGIKRMQGYYDLVKPSDICPTCLGTGKRRT